MLIEANWSSFAPGKLALDGDFKWIRREDAVKADGASRRTGSLGAVWRDLTSGVTKVVDHFTTDDRCYVVTTPAGIFAALERPCPRKVRILESIFLDGNPKSIGIDLRLKASSVATLTKQCLTSMGIRCTLSRTPPQFVMAAFATRGLASADQTRLSVLESWDMNFSVFSVPRPDSKLSTLLSPAQYTVARLFVEGKSHSEIAAARHTTTRTVANQLAGVFERFGVSGRLKLLGKLTTCAALLARPD